MKQRTIIAAIIYALLLSCGSRARESVDEKASVPKGLEKKDNYLEISGRSVEDVVESLYAEVVRNSKELQQLQRQLEKLPGQVADSTGIYNSYESINSNYFSSVDRHVDQITDSALKQQMQALVIQNKQRFKQKMGSRTALMNAIEARQEIIGDLHESIKVLSTIRVMQDYQDKSRPSEKQLQGLIDELNQLKEKMDTVVKKNGG